MYLKAAELQPDMQEAVEAIEALDKGGHASVSMHSGKIQEHY
jgi:hypothetical protein